MRAAVGWQTVCAFLAVIVGLGGTMEVRAGDPFFGMRKIRGNYLEPTVAVGVNRIIEAGNLRVACYDRQGNEQWRASLANDDDGGFSSNHFWSGMPAGTSITDVRCLYDQHSQRFIVTMEDQLAPAPALYMAVSKGYDAQLRPNDPVSWDAQVWDKFRIDTRLGAPGEQVSNFHWTGLAATPDVIFLTSVATTWEIAGEPAGHSVFVLRKPPIGAAGNYYDDPNNYAELEIPLAMGSRPTAHIADGCHSRRIVWSPLLTNRCTSSRFGSPPILQTTIRGRSSFTPFWIRFRSTRFARSIS